MVQNWWDKKSKWYSIESSEGDPTLHSRACGMFYIDITRKEKGFYNVHLTSLCGSTSYSHHELFKGNLRNAKFYAEILACEALWKCYCNMGLYGSVRRS